MPYYSGDYYAGDPQLGGLVAAGRALLPKVTGLLTRAGARFGGTAAAGAGLKGLARKGAAIAAGGAAFEAGSRGLGALFGGEDEERPRSRRMNVLNPRALRRALRRAEGFRRFALRCIKVPTHYKAKCGGKRKRRVC